MPPLYDQLVLKGALVRKSFAENTTLPMLNPGRGRTRTRQQPPSEEPIFEYGVAREISKILPPWWVDQSEGATVYSQKLCSIR